MASLAEQRLGLAPGSFPFASDVRAVGGARLHVVDEGQGPALLMLHGNPTWSFLFRDLIAQLRDRYRCLAVDLPGFGLSEPPPRRPDRPARVTSSTGLAHRAHAGGQDVRAVDDTPAAR